MPSGARFPNALCRELPSASAARPSALYEPIEKKQSILLSSGLNESKGFPNSGITPFAFRVRDVWIDSDPERVTSIKRLLPL